MRVSPSQYRKNFLASEDAAEILVQLQLMEDSPLYATRTSYSAASSEMISFSDKHLTYISLHPALRPDDYLANLRLMTKLH